MITKKLNGHILEIYDSIDELPIERFMLYNRNAMIDAGIGSDVNAYAEHTRNLRRFIENGDTEKANTELNNFEANIYFILSQSSPFMFSFYALLKSVNGRELTLPEIKNPEKLQKELSKKGLTIGKVKGWMSSVKKKFDDEFELFLKEISGASQSKRRAMVLKENTLAKLDQIITGIDRSKDIGRTEKMLFDFYKPLNFGGNKGVEVRSVIDFEDTCNILEKIGFTKPRTLSTLQFFRAVTSIKKENGKNKGK